MTYLEIVVEDHGQHHTHFCWAQTSPAGLHSCLALGATVFDPGRVVYTRPQGQPFSPELAHEELLLGKPSVEGLRHVVVEQLPYLWRGADSWGSQLENSTKGYK